MFRHALDCLFVLLLIAAGFGLHSSAGVAPRIVGAVAALLAGVVLAVGVMTRLGRAIIGVWRSNPAAVNDWLDARGLDGRFLVDDEGRGVGMVFSGWEEAARAQFPKIGPDGATLPPDTRGDLVLWLGTHSIELQRLRLLWAETVGSMLGAEKCTTCGSIADRGCNGEPSCATCACRRCSDREPIARLPWVEQAMLLAQAMKGADDASRRLDLFLERLRAADETPLGTHEHGGGAHGAN